MRLAPDTAKYSWYCEYLGLRRSGRAHLATARFTVHLPKRTGGGSFGVATQAEINLRDQTVTVLNDDIAGELYEQATWKASKALEVLVRERHRRRTGKDRALTIDEVLSHHARDHTCER